MTSISNGADYYAFLTGIGSVLRVLVKGISSQGALVSFYDIDTLPIALTIKSGGLTLSVGPTTTQNDIFVPFDVYHLYSV